MMDAKTIDAVLRTGETINIEFKRCGNGIHTDTFETVCAFLNRFGGDIFLGIENDGTVTGVPEGAVDSVVKNFIKIANDPNQLSPSFYFVPESLRYQGKYIVHIYIPQSSNVHRFKGVCFDRVDDADVKISNTEHIAQMYIRKQNIFTEQRIFPYVQLADLRLDLLPRLRQLVTNFHPEHPWRELSDEALLKSARLYGHDYATNQDGINAAGVLLLGKDEVILNLFPAYKTDAIMRRVNVDRYDDRVTIQTNLIESYEQLFAFGEKHLPDKFYLDHDQRINLRGKILREMLSNTLVHREYTSSLPGRFVIERDRMFTDNANKALHHGSITLQNLRPMPKNPIIGAFFKQVGRADELGSGVRNLYKYVQLYSGSAPAFDEEDVFTLTVPLSDDLDNDGDGSVKKIGEKVGEKVGEKGRRKRSEKTQERICVLLGENPVISIAEAARQLGISSRVAERHVKKLKDAGVLKRIGAAKGGCWEVVGGNNENH